MKVSLEIYLKQKAASLSAYEIVGLWFFAACEFFSSNCTRRISVSQSIIGKNLWDCTVVIYPKTIHPKYFRAFVLKCFDALKSTNQCSCISFLEKTIIDIFQNHSRHTQDVELLASILGRQFLLLRQQLGHPRFSQHPMYKNNFSDLLFAMDNNEEQEKQAIERTLIQQRLNFPFLTCLLRGQITYQSHDQRYRYKPHTVISETLGDESDLEEEEESNIHYQRVKITTSLGESNNAGKVGIFHHRHQDRTERRFLKLIETSLEAAKKEARFLSSYLGQHISVVSLTPNSHILIQPLIEGIPFADYLKLWSREDFFVPDHWQTLAKKLIQAVNQLHQRFIIHGDLHSGNILINLTNGEITFIDFGFASTCGTMARKFPAALKTSLAMKPEWIYDAEDTPPAHFNTAFKDDIYLLHHLFAQIICSASHYAIPLACLFQQICAFPPSAEDCTLEKFAERLNHAINLLKKISSTLARITADPSSAPQLLQFGDHTIETALVAYTLAIHINNNDIDAGVKFLQASDLWDDRTTLRLTDFYNKIPDTKYSDGLQAMCIAAMPAQDKQTYFSIITSESLANLFSFYTLNSQHIYHFLELTPYLLGNSNYIKTLMRMMKTTRAEFSVFLKTPEPTITPDVIDYIASLCYSYCVNLTEEEKRSRLFTTLFSIPLFASWLRILCNNKESRVTTYQMLPQHLTQHITLLQFIDQKINYYQSLKEISADNKSLCLDFVFQCILTYALTQPEQDIAALIDLACMVLGYKRGIISSGIAQGLTDLYETSDLTHPHFQALKQGNANVTTSLFFENYSSLLQKVTRNRQHQNWDFYNDWQQQASAAQPSTSHTA